MGRKKKEWLTSIDGRERPEHNAANGQVVSQQDSFTVGGERLMYPGDPSGSPWNTINCRCTTIPVLEEMAGETRDLPPIENLEQLWQNIANMTPEKAREKLLYDLRSVPQDHVLMVKGIKVKDQGGWVSGRAHITRGSEDYGWIELDPYHTHLWTLRHETGHIYMEFGLPEEEWREVREIYRQDVLEPARTAGATSTTQIENWGLANYVSGYGTLDPDEMFAESYGMWFAPENQGSCRELVKQRSPNLAALFMRVFGQ